MNKQQEYFEKLLRIVPHPLQVTKLRYNSGTNSYTPGRRYNHEEMELHDDRTVASNEIVFDLDFTSYKKNHKYAKKIIEELEDMGIEPLICVSGGKGIHIHIFFDKIDFSSEENKAIFKEALEYGFSYKHMRLWFFDYVLDSCEINQTLRRKEFDSQPLKFDFYAGTSHLIRDIGGQKKVFVEDDYKTFYKTFVDKNFFINNDKKISVTNFENVQWPEEIKTFKLPELELIEYAKNFVQDAQKRDLRPQKNERLDIDYTEIESLQRIREGLDVGLRSKGAMLISIACKIDKKSKTEAMEILQEYVDNCNQSGHRFNIGEAKQWLDWTYSQDRVFWTCQQVAEIVEHNSDTCEYCQAQNREANNLLKSKNILEQIEDILDEEVIGENVNKMLIFLLSLSKDFPSPTGKPNWNIRGDPISQNVILASDSSSGKTYMAKAVMKLFGEEGQDYFILSRITKNVINYYTEQNMDGKIFFVEEMQGLDDATSQLRVWMSEGSLSLDTVEKMKQPDGTEVNVRVTKKTMGQPVFITCQAEGQIEEQLLNRSWPLGLDVSHKQTEKILEYQGSIDMGDTQDIQEKIRIVRDAMKQLKPYHFLIPYADYKALNIPSNEPRARRDFTKFRTLIKCSAYLHQKQRDVYKDRQGREYLICNLQDYDIAKKYAESVLGATFSGLTVNQIDLINSLRNSNFSEEFTVGDLQRMHGKSHTHWYGQMKQLEDLGYVGMSTENGYNKIYTLNKERAISVVSLPSVDSLRDLFINNVADLANKGFELFYKADASTLNRISATVEKNDQNGCGKNNHNREKIQPSSEITLKSLNSTAMDKGDSKNADFKQKSIYAENENLSKNDVLNEKKISAKPGKSLKSEDLLDFMKNHKNLVIEIDELEQVFGDNIHDVIAKFVSMGDIMETKPGKYVVLQ